MIYCHEIRLKQLHLAEKDDLPLRQTWQQNENESKSERTEMQSCIR